MLLFSKFLTQIDPAFRIESFGDGELVLGHIKTIEQDMNLLPSFIFLDFNMPVLDGWGFLNAYSAIRDKLNRDITLYILSSSISPEDANRAMEYPVVSGFLIKPLERSRAEEILGRGLQNA